MKIIRTAFKHNPYLTKTTSLAVILTIILSFGFLPNRLELYYVLSIFLISGSLVLTIIFGSIQLIYQIEQQELAETIQHSTKANL